MHAGTLFSAVALDVRKAELIPIAGSVVRWVEAELRNENSEPNALGALEPATLTLAKTDSRAVLGYMNEMARLCGYIVADSGGLARTDPGGLNRELRRETALVEGATGLHGAD